MLGLRWRLGPAAPVVGGLTAVTALGALAVPSVDPTRGLLVVALVLSLTVALGGVELLLLRSRIARAAGSTAPATPRPVGGGTP